MEITVKCKIRKRKGKIKMNKTNAGYLVKWYGGGTLLVILPVVIGFAIKNSILVSLAFVLAVGVVVVVPMLIKNNMEKKALELEKGFDNKGFSYQFKFTSSSGVFYFDKVMGRVGVVWKNNPFELQFLDLSKITDIHTNDGKQLNGTSLVSCQFNLEGKKMKIYTLRVSNGQLSMKDPRTMEAISKADQLCEILKAAKQKV